MGKKFSDLPTIERIRRKVAKHTRGVLFTWCDTGRGADVDAIVKSEFELVDFIEVEIRGVVVRAKGGGG